MNSESANVTFFEEKASEGGRKAETRHQQERLAERAGSTLYYLLGDHLGSTSVSYRLDNGSVSTLL
jgi:hypothetical protein